MATLDAGVAGVAGVLGVSGIHVGVFGVRGQRRRGLPRPPSNMDASDAFLGRDAVMLRCGGFVLDLSALPELRSVPERTSDLRAVKPGVHGTTAGQAGLAGGVGKFVSGFSVAERDAKLLLAVLLGS